MPPGLEAEDDEDVDDVDEAEYDVVNCGGVYCGIGAVGGLDGVPGADGGFV